MFTNTMIGSWLNKDISVVIYAQAHRNMVLSEFIRDARFELTSPITTSLTLDFRSILDNVKFCFSSFFRMCSLLGDEIDSLTFCNLPLYGSTGTIITTRMKS